MMAACPQCHSSDLVRIDLEPGEDTLRFSACRRCERKWWTRPRDQDAVELPEVLEAVGGARA